MELCGSKNLDEESAQTPIFEVAAALTFPTKWDLNTTLIAASSTFLHLKNMFDDVRNAKKTMVKPADELHISTSTN